MSPHADAPHALVDWAVFAAEVETGAPARPSLDGQPDARACVAIQAPAPIAGRLKWTGAEDEFLRASLGRLSEAEIAARLGRPVMGVHLRWSRDLKLPAPSKDPRYITPQQIGKRLGVDQHKPVRWVDSGLLSGERLPTQGRPMRRVKRVVFLRWLLDPRNWIWFDPRKVPDPHLRRLLELKAERWGDEWWTTRQVAAHHGVSVNDVKRYIALGKLPAVPAPCLGGRSSSPYWRHWFVLRSEATRAGQVFYKGRGCGQEIARWSARGDAFLILARAVGLSTNAIGAMMGWKSQRVSFRLKELHRRGRIPGLVERFALPVCYRPSDGALIADWRAVRDRFPRLAAACDRFAAYLANPCSRYTTRLPRGRHDRDLLAVRGVLAAWAAWYLPGSRLAEDLQFTCHARAEMLLSALKSLREAHGADPFCLISIQETQTCDPKNSKT